MKAKNDTAQKMRIFFKDFFIFTEKVLNGKLHSLRSLRLAIKCFSIIYVNEFTKGHIFKVKGGWTEAATGGVM